MTDDTPLPTRGGLFEKPTAIAVAVIVGVVIGGVGMSMCSGPSTPAHDHNAMTAAADTTWTCSMHPQIRQGEPGRCPICGMDLIPVDTGSDDDDNADGRAIVLSARAKALAQVRTTSVVRQDGSAGSLRLLGHIEPNEKALKTVTAWTAGRIDALAAKVTGEKVRAGQVVATLYSPEIFAAHKDVLVAMGQVARTTSSPPSASSDATSQAATAMLNAAKQRLRLLGVPDDDIERLARDTEATTSVPIRTPFGGTVIERAASEGAYVSTGSVLYRIADLTTLWVQLDAYERDLPSLAVGQKVLVTVEGAPDDPVEGEVAFIDPVVDTKRRTAKVRVQIQNPTGALRPGMFVEATVASTTPMKTATTAKTSGAKADKGEAAPGPLVIPSTAPLFTGRRSIVYVETDTEARRTYQAREVRLGPRLGAVYPVVAGLSEGERVVTHGAFAIDADLQIRGGKSMMTSSADSDVNSAGASDAAGVVVVDISAVERAKLEPVVTAYLALHHALATDDLAQAKAAAQGLHGAVDAVTIARPAAAVAAWKGIAVVLSRESMRVSTAPDVEGARVGFEALSGSIEALLRRFGNPTGAPLRLAYCPMAAGSRGASWIQRGVEVENAYFGASMFDCGEIKRAVAPGDRLTDGDKGTP